jgi:hypothetical protein
MQMVFNPVTQLYYCSLECSILIKCFQRHTQVLGHVYG